jgi:hypothetical protein
MGSNRTKVVGEQVVTTPEVRAVRIDLTAGTTTKVCEGAAMLRGVNVNSATGFAVDFLAGVGGAAVDSIPAATPPGTWLPYGDAYYPNGIYTSHNASETASITVKYIPLS